MLELKLNGSITADAAPCQPAGCNTFVGNNVVVFKKWTGLGVVAAFETHQPITEAQ